MKVNIKEVNIEEEISDILYITIIEGYIEAPLYKKSFKIKEAHDLQSGNFLGYEEEWEEIFSPLHKEEVKLLKKLQENKELIEFFEEELFLDWKSILQRQIDYILSSED